jgi:hypothetical protein
MPETLLTPTDILSTSTLSPEEQRRELAYLIGSNGNRSIGAARLAFIDQAAIALYASQREVEGEPITWPQALDLANNMWQARQGWIEGAPRGN